MKKAALKTQNSSRKKGDKEMLGEVTVSNFRKIKIIKQVIRDFQTCRKI